MVVVMKERATEAQVDAVIARLIELGMDVHRSSGATRTVLGVVGAHKVEPELIEILDGVHEVLRITEPYKRASRTFKPEDTIVTIDDVRIGGDEVIVMAGPCSAETDEQVHGHAPPRCKRAGAKILRGGAFKPRSSPYSFQGLGEQGLQMLRRAADAHNLKLISEVMDISQIELIAKYCDIFQVGARNMQNYTLLRELGHARKPVLLKRGISATIEEWLLSAEYILAGGNNDVILCERGIRTFETATRNTFDISAIPVVKKLSHLPIVADPEPRRRTPRHGGADGARGGGRRRRRPDHRGAQRSGSRAERRRAVDVPGAVRPPDGGAAHHRAGHRPQHLPRAGGAARVESRLVAPQPPFHTHRHRRPRPDRRVDRARRSASAGRRCRVVGVDRRPVLAHALGSGAIDRAADEPRGRRRRRPDRPGGAGPPERRAARRRSGQSTCASTTVVTDVGGTKRDIVERPRRFRAPRSFVGGHPIGGAERGGFGFARPDLFEGRPWIFTPDETTLPTRSIACPRFVQRPRRASDDDDAAEHDRLMAFVSHLPQLAASALMEVVGRRRGRRAALAGRGLVDTTRLASSPAGVWRDICAANADAIGEALDRLIERLTLLRADLRSGDAIDAIFDDAARWRAELMKTPR